MKDVSLLYGNGIDVQKALEEGKSLSSVHRNFAEEKYKY